MIHSKTHISPDNVETSFEHYWMKNNIHNCCEFLNDTWIVVLGCEITICKERKKKRRIWIKSKLQKIMSCQNIFCFYFACVDSIRYFLPIYFFFLYLQTWSSFVWNMSFFAMMLRCVRKFLVWFAKEHRKALYIYSFYLKL